MGDSVEIALENNFLTGTLPSKLGQLPSSLASLSNIKLLYLYNNRFTGTSPDELCNVKTLTDYYTDCGGTYPMVICHCCTACCTSTGCYQDAALKMKESHLMQEKSRNRMPPHREGETIEL